MPTLTVFTNFRINDEERLLRMKDSFASIRGICAQKWVVNVRGSYRDEALSFLRQQLGEKLSAHAIESGKGWFHDTRGMLPEIRTDYLLYWVEDHISMVDAGKYVEILHEMQQSGSEFLFTSWWVHDQYEKPYEGITKDEYENISSFLVDVAVSRKILEKCPKHYIISACGLFSSDLFKRIVSVNDPKLRRWPKETPFDLEKKATDFHWLPIKTAIPNYELFAPIDDDMDGYPGCLQTRGLYPKRALRNADTAATLAQCSLVLRIAGRCFARVEFWLFKLETYHKIKRLWRRVKYHF
jgi:hypothetical protein